MTTQTQEITLTQTISASPSRVYDAFTLASGWCEWCCEQAETEVMLGGKLHIYTEGYNAYGEFTELEPGRSVAFTWNGVGEPPTLIQVSLVGEDNRTRLKFKVTGLGTQADWIKIVDFLESTWGRVLNNLKAVLEANPET